ncbi:MAG: polysaccharide deacetylase family protein [Acutalibacteraceae bacterium]
MKRITALLLSAAMILTLTACGKKGTQLENTSGSQIGSSTAERQSPQIIQSTQVQQKDSEKPSAMIVTGEPQAQSLSGFAPLEPVSYTVSDPGNTRGLSVKKVSHSHGPASGGKPHHTVVTFQDTFDQYGALTLDRVSEGKVLYLTFDCGYEYENLTSKILDVLKEKQVKAAFFCTLDHIKREENLIARMIREGHIVGNHSATHPSFPSISREKMAQEIEKTENYLREHFGYAARYFRFPAGEYSESALDAVQSLGYMSVFWSVAYDDWNVDKVRGKDYAIEKVMSRLHDGAIILLHSVSRDNAAALGEIIDKARAEGYEFRSLSEYPGSI